MELFMWAREPGFRSLCPACMRSKGEPRAVATLERPEGRSNAPWPADGARPPAAAGGLRTTRTVMIAMVLAAFVAVAGLAIAKGRERPHRAPAPSKPAAYETINDVVASLSGFVEKARGLKFITPVPVKVLSDAAFDQRLRSGQQLDVTQVNGHLATLRALGLVTSDVDVAKEQDDEVKAVQGFYDPATKQLYVRGVGTTPYVRYVLVHELTHALQDQHFDLMRMMAVKDDALLAARSIIEGDAYRVQSAYFSTLSGFEQDVIQREAVRRGDDIYAPVSFYVNYANFPYGIGKRFTHELLQAGGQAQLDAGFARPPTSSEQIIDGARYLLHDDPIAVAPPPAGGAIVDQGVLGQFDLIGVLAGTLGSDGAQVVASDWGGSRYVTWQDGARACTRAAFVMDDPGATARLAEGLRLWAGAHPGASVRVGSSVELTACSA